MHGDQVDRDWANEEFGLAQLGDKRRTRRLVQVAAAAANAPAGQVTAVFAESAPREGAFRLLENEAVAPEAIALASHRACARRLGGAEYAFVAVDGTSLNITDTKGEKGTGLLGARLIGATGVQVMTALCMSPEGVPLGLCGQKYWAREERAAPTGKHDRRPLAAKETKHWLDVMQQARKVFATEAPQTRPWFQLDRGGDAWPIILDGLRPGELFTVRATHNRRLTKYGTDEQRRYLWDELESKSVLGTLSLDVRRQSAQKGRERDLKPPRAARTATIEVRAAKVSLDLGPEMSRKRVAAELYAVLACETSESAGDDPPIEWLLLTSRPVASLQDAQLVLYGYAQRWRIEEFHKCWKSGVCKVEHMQLRHIDNMERWATVLAAVAVRVLRLTYLSRHAPWLPATEELTPAEIDAIVLGSKSKDHKPGTVPPIEEVTRLVAQIGGYIGPSSGGPPGPLTISRGLLKIEVLADLLQDGVVSPRKEM